TAEDEWWVKAERLIGAFTGRAGAMVQSPGLLGATDLLAGGASVVVAGTYPELVAVARKAPDPALVVLVVGEAAAVPARHPAAGKLAGATVCRGGACSLPVTEAAALAVLLHRT
ncbi:MAG: thioredoxin domain-containing protein, partial [Acetobacteraceae bacterium]